MRERLEGETAARHGRELEVGSKSIVFGGDNRPGRKSCTPEQASNAESFGFVPFEPITDSNLFRDPSVGGSCYRLLTAQQIDILPMEASPVWTRWSQPGYHPVLMHTWFAYVCSSSIDLP